MGIAWLGFIPPWGNGPFFGRQKIHLRAPYRIKFQLFMMMKIKIMMMTILIIILVKLCPFKSIVSLRMARKCAKRRLFLVALFLWIYFCLTVFVAFIIWFEFVFLNLYFLSIYCTCKCFHIIWCPICKASIDISNNFSYCLKCYLCFGFHILNLGFCISHLVFCVCAS